MQQHSNKGNGEEEHNYNKLVILARQTVLSKTTFLFESNSAKQESITVLKEEHI